MISALDILVLSDVAFSRELLDKAVTHYGINASLMNLTGECYLGLGKAPEALAAFERSLGLSPEQPKIRQKVEEIRKKAAR